MLEFQKAVSNEITLNKNCYVVLAKGLCTVKLAACFLHNNFACLNSPVDKKDGWPFLIFLINFEDHEFEALEVFLRDLNACDQNSQSITLVNMKGEVAKRSDLYLKGGLFCISYKQLVLDLLSKKVSPLIISGIVVNSAHKCHKETDCETFLIKMIKRESPNTFVKCFSDSPEVVKRGGLIKLEAAMRALHVDKLLLVPRISGAVQKSLDDDIKSSLHVAERTV